MPVGSTSAAAAVYCTSFGKSICIQSAKKFYPPCRNFFPNSLEFLIKILDAYYTFTFMLNYKILFSYFQLWQSYTVLSTTTQWIFTFSQHMHSDQWPPNSHDLNPFDYHVWVQCFRHFTNFTQSQKPFQSYSKCTVADLGWLATDNSQQSYQWLSQMSEHMGFGYWWTLWAYDVDFVQKYFNLTFCCFIKCKKILF